MGTTEMKIDDVVVATVEPVNTPAQDPNVVEKVGFTMRNSSSANFRIGTEEEASTWLDNARKLMKDKGLFIKSISMYYNPPYRYKKHCGTMVERAPYWTVSISASSTLENDYNDDFAVSAEY